MLRTSFLASLYFGPLSTYLKLSNDLFVSSAKLTIIDGNGGLIAVDLFNDVGSLSNGGDSAGVLGVEDSGEIESGACHFVFCIDIW